MWPSSFLSGVAQMRIGTPSDAPSRHWKSPTAIATRYEDIFAVVENFIVCWLGPGPGVSERIRPFEIAVSALSAVTVTANVALNSGSSKPGKARRASVDSNCVTAYERLLALLMYSPRRLALSGAE